MIGALTAHREHGRLLMASRRVSAETLHAIASDVSAETRSIRVESVDALSADEALHDPDQALAGHLISAVIRKLTDAGGTTYSVREAVSDLRMFGAEPPTGVADLCDKLGDIPGTDPAGLIARISPDPEMAERTLQELIAKARELAETLPEDATPE